MRLVIVRAIPAGAGFPFVQLCCVIILSICRAMGPWSEGIWGNDRRRRGVWFLSEMLWVRALRLWRRFGLFLVFYNLRQPPGEDWMKSTLAIQGIADMEITLSVHYRLIHYGVSRAMRHNPGGSLALASRQFIIHRICKCCSCNGVRSKSYTV